MATLPEALSHGHTLEKIANPDHRSPSNFCPKPNCGYWFYPAPKADRTDKNLEPVTTPTTNSSKP